MSWKLAGQYSFGSETQVSAPLSLDWVYAYGAPDTASSFPSISPYQSTNFEDSNVAGLDPRSWKKAVEFD